MALPPPEDEDAFVAALAGADDDVLLDAIAAAMDARRVRLAARLVLALPDDVEDPVAIRARRAAGLVLHRKLPADAPDADLDEAWAELRAWRRVQARRRERRGLAEVRPLGWTDPWSRRRR